MGQNLFDWMLLIIRWFHIVAGISWIGESLYFMWLDRSLEKNPDNKHPGHVGELWMVHGGGFYRVDKLLIGPTKVPEKVHWFKWEALSTWISGMLLLALIFYTGQGTFLLDENVSSISYGGAVGLSLLCVFGSWFIYDLLWETKFAQTGFGGHIITLALLVGLTWVLTHTISGRAAYIHMAAIMGTWMVGNVWMRILPRQQKMIDASNRGEEVNQKWGVNAKFRSTHNTYFTLPIIFIMISNHFPSTYGHDMNWLVLILICIAGAVVRQYFVLRESLPGKARLFLAPALVCFLILFNLTLESDQGPIEMAEVLEVIATPTIESTPLGENHQAVLSNSESDGDKIFGSVEGLVTFSGTIPDKKKLRLPKACMTHSQGPVYLDNVRLQDNKLENVLIRISKGLIGRNFSDNFPASEIVLDQKGCIYVPRVVAARVGQKVRFVNSDPIFHNVKTLTQHNQKFNKAMPKQNTSFTKVFNKPEFHIQTKCSLHPWMGAFIAVLDHPFYQVTKSDGKFAIQNIPAGTYTLEAWHEVFGKIEKSITIAPGTSDQRADFNFK